MARTAFQLRSGETAIIDTSESATQHKWGYAHLDRIVTPRGSRATVLGTGPGNFFYVHKDGEQGASFWASVKSRKELEERGFRKCESSDNTVRYKPRMGDELTFDTTFERCAPFGFFTGERVKTPKGPATVVGVSPKGHLFFHVDRDIGASFWGKCKTRDDFVRRGFVLLSEDKTD